jgi:cytoskeleton protein RodZ
MTKSAKSKNTQADFEATEHNPDVRNTGAYLRKIREDKGLSIQDISQATRISTKNLHAMEENDYTALPADTFTRGFLAIYARFLGMDAAQITSGFMQERDQKLVQGKHTRLRQTKHIQSAKKLSEPSYISSLTMAGILLVIILAVFISLTLFTSWRPFDFLTSGNGGNPEEVIDMLSPGDQEGTVFSPENAPTADEAEESFDSKYTAPESLFNSAGQDE